MSGRRKRNSVTAPSWFKLEKYDKQESLDLPGWLLQFGVRRDLLMLLEGRHTDVPDGREKKICAEILGWIRQDPILQWDRVLAKFGPLAVQMILPSLAPLHSWQPRNDMAVHPTTTEELYRSQIALDPQFRARTEKFYEQMRRNIDHPESSSDYCAELDHRIKIRKAVPMLEEGQEDEEKLPYDPLIGHPLYCNSLAMRTNFLFTVNIALPDKLLEVQLRDAIQRVRTYFSNISDISTRLPAEPTADWIDEQLLAYLDLRFERYMPDGVRLTQQETANLLWSPDRSGKGSIKCWGAEHLNSITASLATEMMAEYSEAFWTLQASAAAVLAKPSLDLNPPDSLSPGYAKPTTRRNRWRNK
jgi:hypothetical protein